MEWRRLVGATALSVLGCAVVATAQSGTTERKEKTKIEIKDGKDVTLTGCLERSSGVTSYVLTDEAGLLKYAVVTDDDLGRYVDHRVEIKGRAADRGDGKVKIERKTEGTSGRETESKVEAKGDTTVLPYLGLKSIKSVGPSCGR
jgi:phosphohistidine swiveling domain-containing protein